jgi:CubicO group peptidase (beta-lactamase class C family)
MRLAAEGFLRAACTVFLLLLFSMLVHSDDKSDRVDSWLTALAGQQTPGGSVAVIRDGKVIYQRGYGLADLENEVANTPATNFRLASLTKQFTAMSVMILVQQRKLDYDASLSRFFPELPSYASEVTLRQMLHHTSGLPDYEDAVPKDTPQVNTPPRLQLHERDVLRFLKTQKKLLFPAGSEYRYSNTGYVLLGMIVEKASGMSLPQYLKKTIFDPLGMRDTVMHVDGRDSIAHRAFGYSRHGDGFVRTDQSPTSATLGDGAIYSSVEDLAKWDRELYAHTLVSAAAFEEAISPGVLSDGKKIPYGFGWQLGDVRGSLVMEHSGTTIGFRNFTLRIPDRRLLVIVLMNRTDAKPGELAHKIADLYSSPR